MITDVSMHDLYLGRQWSKPGGAAIQRIQVQSSLYRQPTAC
jgi:hypothetical protein